MDLEEIRKTGGELTSDELSECKAILEHGKAVDAQEAMRQLPLACAVVLLRLEGTVVGLGAIKAPRADYARRIAGQEKSNHTFDPAMHELGYVAVVEEHRGKGGSGKIVKALMTQFPGPLWATTDKPAMKRTLEKNGFKRFGTAWLNKDRSDCLSLWIKDVANVHVKQT
jgi:RimJ/RimL family protein N-acetyltransferase